LPKKSRQSTLNSHCRWRLWSTFSAFRILTTGPGISIIKGVEFQHPFNGSETAMRQRAAGVMSDWSVAEVNRLP
jgi:hypothetical protein